MCIKYEIKHCWKRPIKSATNVILELGMDEILLEFFRFADEAFKLTWQITKNSKLAVFEMNIYLGLVR